jgi:two-component system KDP operon response regulator KdpE
MEPVTVLAVDDDWMVTRLIKYNLENRDIRVIAVETGLDCLKMVCQEYVDLVLLDLGLPDFNGWGILSLLRLTQFLRNIPVIIISVRPPDQSLMRQFAPDDYIQKPFDVRDLVEKVRKLIESRNIK